MGIVTYASTTDNYKTKTAILNIYYKDGSVKHIEMGLYTAHETAKTLRKIARKCGTFSGAM